MKQRYRNQNSSFLLSSICSYRGPITYYMFHAQISIKCKVYRVTFSSSSSMALQSNADLRLLNGLLPVISIDLSVLRPHLRSPNCWLFTGWGRQPHAQPPTWRTRSPYLYPLETGWPSYTPRHRVPILVAFYDMHGLQWDYSFPWSPHGVVTHVTFWKIILCITPMFYFFQRFNQIDKLGPRILHVREDVGILWIWEIWDFRGGGDSSRGFLLLPALWYYCCIEIAKLFTYVEWFLLSLASITICLQIHSHIPHRYFQNLLYSSLSTFRTVDVKRAIRCKFGESLPSIVAAVSTGSVYWHLELPSHNKLVAFMFPPRMSGSLVVQRNTHTRKQCSATTCRKHLWSRPRNELIVICDALRTATYKGKFDDQLHGTESFWRSW
jgi:hypothetical protein